MKKTGWYSGRQKPMREGLYERDTGFIYHFDGIKWFIAVRENDGSIINTNIISFLQNIPWRGLSKNPKGKK